MTANIRNNIIQKVKDADIALAFNFLFYLIIDKTIMVNSYAIYAYFETFLKFLHQVEPKHKGT